MGGPYCETCNHFYQPPLSGDEGECQDPCKIIYAKYGDRINSTPSVHKTNDCCNHSGLTHNNPIHPLDKEVNMKTLHNSDISKAKVNVPNLQVFGNGDMFQLLSKASSEREGWMKSTKAMQIPSVGCVVQVTTQQGDNVAEALCFVPGVKIVKDSDKGGKKLEVGI